MTLAGRHAVVTGGGSGVGAAIAVALTDAGADVTILGRRREALDEVTDGHASMSGLVADVTERASLDRALAEARERSGPVTVMVANAGISSSRPFHRLDVDEFRATLDVNTIGTFHSFQAALPDMRSEGWGRLVAVASTAGLTGYPYVSHYCASKHAVVGMVRALAHEIARRGITVNAVCPSYVDTPMTTRTLDNIEAQTGRSRDEALAALTDSNPQGRLVTPGEVAATVSWLCSDGAAAVNGQAIAIDGGEL